jgi:ribosome-associated heat shock protein Hsp15
MAAGEEGRNQPASTQRLDKWLFFARLVKSRTLATQLVEAGRVRVNRVRAGKASQSLRPGDVVTLALGGRLRVVRVLSCGVRRGPAAEAGRLYALLSPAPDRNDPSEEGQTDKITPSGEQSGHGRLDETEWGKKR